MSATQQPDTCPCKGTCEASGCGAKKWWSGVWWDHCGNTVKAGGDPTTECKACRKGNWAVQCAQTGGHNTDLTGQKELQDVVNTNDEMMQAIVELKDMMKAIAEGITEAKEEIKVLRKESKETKEEIKVLSKAIEEFQKIQVAASFFDTPSTDT